MEPTIDLDGGDVIEVGGPGRPSRGGRLWWLAAGLAVVVVAAIGYANRSQPPPTPHATPPATGLITSPAIIVMPNSTPAVIAGTHPLLGVTAGWDLLARSSGAMARIEMATGRITITGLPPLESDAPVSFVAGSDWAMIRSLDQVPGYVVTDGQPARESTWPRSDSQAWPGPDPSHLWTEATGEEDGDDGTVQLVDVRGRPTGTRIEVPTDMNGSERSDGAGYMLLTGSGGTYDARPDGLTRVTTGTLLAIGAHQWLTSDCDDHHVCATDVIDRATGARRVLPGYTPSDYAPTGLIAPDGRTAAMFSPSEDGSNTIHLIDLATGADRPTRISVATPFDSSMMVWSPDSTWLFVADKGSPLRALNAAVNTFQELTVPLAAIEQLAIRDTP